MANTTFSNPAAGLGDAARFGEIRGRLLFLVAALVVYRIGTFIPVPGINPSEVARFFTDCEALYSYEGTYQMQNLIVGKTITGISAFI